MWNLSDCGVSHLVEAAVAGDTQKVSMLLSDRHEDKEFQQALSCAVWGGHTNVTRVLLEHRQVKCFVNVADSDGDTALHRASSKGDFNMCKLLLEHGANYLSRNKFGRTALLEASRKGCVTVCELLLRAGIPINDVDENDDTALHHASRSAHPELCRVLVDGNANTLSPNKDGNTALHLAAELGDVNIIRMLIEAGSNCKLTNKAGNTPLHLASSNANDVACRILVETDPSCLIEENKAGKIPLDVFPSFFYLEDLKRYLQKATQKLRYNKLKASGERPVKTIKLFLCGDPGAGKTTLKKTISTGRFASLIRRSRRAPAPHVKTPGISVREKIIRGAGAFVIWDMAGQIEYHVTHAMLLRSSNGVFVLVYDASEPVDNQLKTLKYWLSFIKAGRNPQNESQNLVVVVGTHIDLLGTGTPRMAEKQTAQKNLDELIQIYGEYLTFHQEVIMVDARNAASDKIAHFIETLKTLTEPLRSALTPSICADIAKFLPEWSKTECPILYWPEFVSKVRTDISELIDESLVRLAVAHLHDMGELHHAKVDKREDLIILDPNWLTNNIFGPIFATPDFRSDYHGLGEKQVYQLHDLRARFTIRDPNLLVTLLEYFELAYRKDEDTFIIPLKLPPGVSEIHWTPDQRYTYYFGLRIECRDATDMLTDDVFPCLQVRAMNRYRQEDTDPKLSRSGLKVFDEVEGMIQLAEDKRAIHIGVRMLAGKKQAGMKQLNELKEMVLQQISQRSRGTQINVCYLSPRAMQASSDIETNVQFYRKEAVQEALKNGKSLVNPDSLVPETVESVTGIVQQRQGPLASVDDVSLRDLSKQIGDEWEALATYLRMTHAFIHRLKVDHPNMNDRIFSMLVRWRQMQPQSVNKVTTLAMALEKAGRVDLAQGTKDSALHLSDINLRDLACKLGTSWISLAICLQFSREDICKAQEQHTFVEDTIFNMLVTWRQRQPHDKDLQGTLTSVLARIGRSDLAKELLEKQLSTLQARGKGRTVSVFEDCSGRPPKDVRPASASE